MPRSVDIATASDVLANPTYRRPAVPSIDDDASAPMVADVFRGIEPETCRSRGSDPEGLEQDDVAAYR